MTEERFDLRGLAVGQVWEHKNGNIYEIYDFTNLSAGRQDEYPTRVSYRNIHTGEPYSRDVVRWAGSFKRREDLEAIQDWFVQIRARDVNGEEVGFEDTVATNTQRKAIEYGRERLLARTPDAKIFWVNATGDVVAGVRIVDNG